MLTKEVIEQHGLSLAEYEKILTILGREPNINELGLFSVMWSEHCSYKSSKIHLKKLPTTGACVIQGPGENAGIIDIGDGDAIAFKIESHNHPSFIEPYQGAATGVGGIMRDVFTMGARPIANLNSLRFGDPEHEKTAYLVSGVVAGIAAYGNCMGVPTVGGEVYFDACYSGNILVNAMTVGHVRTDKIFKGIASGTGNSVMYVGSKTGRDGIHGATMASDSFDEESAARRPTVQVGDPFMEKLLLEACLEVMETDAIVGIQDMGAAGLTSSLFEMASRAGTGIKLNLDKVPQREEGMTAYEILLSESQERMLMVVAKGKETAVKEIFDKWDLDAVVVGQVTDSQRMVVTHKNEVVVDVPIDPLAQAAPQYDRPRKPPAYLQEISRAREIAPQEDIKAAIISVLASPTIASKKWVYRQYDHMVMTSSLSWPGTSDAALVRVGDTHKALSLTVNCNSRYCYLNPRLGAQHAVAECGRNIVCSGATPMAVTDCLNFGSPEDPEIMWQFVESCEGIAEACRIFKTPVVSGNVSFYNDTKGAAIFPTPTIGMVGLIKDLSFHLPMGFQNSGDIILLLGETKAELGGSEYLKQRTGRICGECPQIDLAVERRLWEVILELNQKRLLKSAHDLSEGGFIVALLEAAFAAHLGFSVSLKDSLRVDEFLFSESPSRVLVTVNPGDVEAVSSFLKQGDVAVTNVGVVGGGMEMVYNDKKVVSGNGEGLREAYDQGFTRTVFSTS